MKIKGLWDYENYPYHHVVQLEDGSYKMFPYGITWKVKESDLMDFPKHGENIIKYGKKTELHRVFVGTYGFELVK